MEYGLVGAKLGHSFSPELHRAIGGYEYGLTELTEAELAPFFHARAFRGVNVTIPYKSAVIPLLDEVSPEARRIGAVNTVVNRGGRLFGYNTGTLSNIIITTDANPTRQPHAAGRGYDLLCRGGGGGRRDRRPHRHDLGRYVPEL